MIVKIFRQTRLAGLSALALLAGGAWDQAAAVPPTAATNVVVKLSRSALVKDVNGSLVAAVSPRSGPKVDITGGTHSYLLQWKDNALDEEGYRIEARVGNAGPFSPVAIEAANTTEAFIFPINGFAVGNILQFQVVAWKYNGAKLETSTSATATFTMPENSPAGSSAGTLASPSNLVATNVNDGTIKLTWKDNGTGELYYQLLMRDHKESPDTPLPFSHLTMRYFDTVEQSLQLNLVPGKKYDFQVFATRQPALANPPVFDTLHISGGSNIVTVTVPPLAAPTGLSGTATGENNILLQWNDNSFNESGYKIMYRLSSSAGGAYDSLGTVNANTRSINVPTPQGSSVEWQVVAVYTYRPEGAASSDPDTVVESAPSNPVVVSTTFPPPTNLTATTSGYASTVDLTWTDNSASEYGYNIMTRPVGGTTWFFARAVNANVTKVSVNSRTETNNGEGRPVFIPLEVGVSHEFVVRAVNSDLEDNSSAVSPDSNTATAVARDGFVVESYDHDNDGDGATATEKKQTSRPYHPAKVNGSFEYWVKTSNTAGRTSWDITGLPPGLTFDPVAGHDNSAGLVTNTAVVTTPGLYVCTMTAHFPGGTATVPLTIRVLPLPGSPVVGAEIPDTTVGINAPFLVPLAGKFADADSETPVRLVTTKGTIDMMLYPSLAPNAVANFLSYVNAGDYDGLAFHRLVEGFVLQAGSLKPVGSPRSFAGVASRTPAVNEPGISNLRGTIATAKVGARNSYFKVMSGDTVTNIIPKDESFGYVGNPDSGTTDFFFNLSDNNVANLDNQNSGFTVFGKVTSAGMNVVDTIADLPIGSYQNDNENGVTSGSTYDATLDRRIVVDGAATAFSGIPMDAQDEAPEDMDVNKTVRITKASVIPALSYSITTLPTGIATAALVGSDLKIVGLKVGATTVTVTATDLDGNTVSQEVQVNVVKNHKAPVITRHPLAAAAAPGGKVTLTVAATGTGLAYQWRKDGVDLPGKTTASLLLPSVQLADEGVYDVKVSNLTTTLTSNPARVDLKEIPAITLAPQSTMVEVGKPLILDTAATGAPVPTIAWKRGAAGVAGQTKVRLNIPAAKLTDAGVYTAIASNASGKATSAAASVWVVDKATKLQVVSRNVKATLVAPAAGPNMTYQWRKDGVDMLPDAGRFKGTQGPSLVISGTQEGVSGDSGEYTCQVTFPDSIGSSVTGIIRLAVVSSKPVLTDFTIPTAFIGTNYSFAIPYNPVLTNTPTGFTVTGLPTGLKYNNVTGVISGRPTKTGVFPLTATMRNVAGTSAPAAKASLTVAPLPTATVGTFVGTIGASAALNADMGGRIDLTVTDTTAFTAKVVLGKDTFNTAGTLAVGVGLFDVTNLSYQSRITIPRKAPLVPLTLAFEVNESLGYVSGVLTDGTAAADVRGFRLFWQKDLKPCSFFSGLYNLGLNVPAVSVGNAAVPQGSGYVSVKVIPAGTATIAGRLADGTTVTASSIVGPLGDLMLFQMYYKNTGSILGRIDIGDTNLSTTSGLKLRVTGQVRWFKNAQTLATERSYKAGIPATMLDVVGTNYYPPGANTAVMGLPTSTAPNLINNANLDFSEGGLGVAAIDPDVETRITSTHIAVFPAAGSDLNKGKVRMTLVASTGAFTGAFDLVDGTVKRTVTYQGLLIPTIPVTPAVAATSTSAAQAEIPPTGASGVGYFLLPQLPSATPPVTTLTNSPIMSGRIVLKPFGVTIVTHPEALTTVNPGTPVSLTVAASAQTGAAALTYQWKKNGTSMAGKTSATLNLGNVVEADQASYVCEVSNGAAVAASNPGVVEVNDPVANVQASRNPALTTVARETSVTFTVAATGTAPLTYQWRKAGVDIDGATNMTYTISSVQDEDAGNYSVVVKNIVTTGGVTSNTVALGVGTGVSNVVASRTPADTTLNTGDSVTFSFTADGAPFTAYQWRKDGVAVTGATSATYTINSLNPDHAGNYSVMVSNAASSGVVSNDVALAVSEVLTSVTATVSPGSAVVPNTTVTFSTNVPGANNTYQWRINGVPIDGATQSSYVLNDVTSADTNNYDVVVTNPSTPAGVASNVINLVVAEPVSNVAAFRTPDTPVVLGGNPVTFSVTADGTAPFFYQWRKNGQPIQGATESSYTIPSPVDADDGTYSVQVGNAVTTGGDVVISNNVELQVDP